MISEDLITSCIARNNKAQKELYLSLLPYLRAIANRYLRDTSYVKDVLQESFVKIFRNIDKFDSNKAPFKQWAAKIVINSSFNYNDRVIGLPKEEFSIVRHEKAIAPFSIEDLSNDYLLNVLKQMPVNYFEVFNLFVIDEYKHDEIGNILNISDALSRKRLSRAKKWIKLYFNTNSVELTNMTSLSFTLKQI